MCNGKAPAFVTAAVKSNRKAIIGRAETVARLICEITSVPESVHTISIPSRKAASDAPIIAKLFVAAKLEFFPPVVIKRYKEAVTISQKISRNNKLFESSIPAEPPRVSRIEPKYMFEPGLFSEYMVINNPNPMAKSSINLLSGVVVSSKSNFKSFIVKTDQA